MFKNYADYKAQRDALIAQAEQAIGTDGYDAAVKAVKELDEAWTEYAQAQADILALKGAAKAPMTDAAATTMIQGGNVPAEDDLEYRKAFMNYVLKGGKIPQRNEDTQTKTSDVGAVIPSTIINKIYKKLTSAGSIYAKVTKTNIKGGVTVPRETAKPVATWVAERAGSDTQKHAIGGVTFAYHKLRCVIANSFEVVNVTLDIFENDVAESIAEAMMAAIDKAIIAGEGSASHQPEGIITATAPTGQTVEIAEGSHVTYADLLKAEGALPAAYDDAEWCMRKSTFMNEVLGMVDDNGQPIARASVGIDGKPAYYILGRRVEFSDDVPAFATTVTADTVVAFIYRFKDYFFNTNYSIGVKKYTDEATDDECTKALMLADGKPVDLNSLVKVVVKNG